MNGGTRGDILKRKPLVFVSVFSLYFIFSAFLVLVQRDVYGLDSRVGLFLRAIVEGKGLFCPVLFNTPYPDYPPLYFLLAAPFCLIGSPESALCIALPSLLSAAGLLILVFMFTRRYLGDFAALLSSAVLFSIPEFWLKAERATVDMVLGLLVFCSNWFLFEGFSETEGHRGVKKSFGLVFMAASYLVKGPVGPLLCIIPTGAYLIARKRFKSLSYFLFLSGAICVLVMAFYLLGLFYQGGFDLVVKVIHAQLLSRLSGRANKPFYYYFLYLLWAFGPWLAVVVLSCFKRSGECLGALRKCVVCGDFNLFIAIMAIGATLPFFFASSRHGRYLLPAFPALSIIVSCLVLERCETLVEYTLLRATAVNLKRIIVIVSALLLAISLFQLQRDFYLFLATVVFAVVSFLLVSFLEKNLLGGCSPIFLYAFLLLVIVAGPTLVVEPDISKKESGKQFVLETEKAIGPDSTIFLYKLKKDGEALKYCLFSRYYPDRIRLLKDPSHLGFIPHNTVLVMYKADFDRLSKGLSAKSFQIISTGYIHNKSVIGLYF